MTAKPKKGKGVDPVVTAPAATPDEPAPGYFAAAVLAHRQKTLERLHAQVPGLPKPTVPE